MRNPLFVRPLLVAFGLVFLYGCASSRPPVERTVPEAFPNHTTDQILLNLHQSSDTLQSFRARASVSIRSEDNGGQFSADMHGRKNDSLYVGISPGLGIEAARALVTPDSFFFYDRIKNRLVYGDLDEATDLLPEPFVSKNLFETLLGLAAPSADTQWEISNDTAYYYLHEVNGTTTYVIDPAFWRVVRLEQRDAEGALVERRTFSEFDRFDGVILPRRLEFDRPGDGQRASIYYRDVTLNTEDLSFALRVRDSADRVPATE